MFRIPLNSFTTRALVGASKTGRNSTTTTSTCHATSLLFGTTTKCFMSTNFPSSGMFDKVAFIGTGKMAQAMIQPMIDTKIQPEERVAVYDVSVKAVESLKKRYPNVQVANSIADLVKDADFVVCCVKPQNIDEKFYNQFPEENIRDDATLLSILAGTPMVDLEPIGFKKIVRSMPNTPATIGQGMTVWSCTDNLTTVERSHVKGVLDTFGKTIYVDDEKFIDMSTSISGSGPAYIFMLMEAMIDAGVHMGFNRDTATTLCHHTLLGSTLYAMETGEHPAILRNMVTSPAGTTASAIYELENGKFRVVIKDAIWACYRRSLEMGGKSSIVGPGRAHPDEIEVIHHQAKSRGPSGEMARDLQDEKK